MKRNKGLSLRGKDDQPRKEGTDATETRINPEKYRKNTFVKEGTSLELAGPLEMSEPKGVPSKDKERAPRF